MAMRVDADKIRSYRLRAHHLNKKMPADALLQAAGACGLQNTPPGAWETALFNRLQSCSLQDLHAALYRQKSLLQAWSYRGVPVVFPTGQSDVFLTPLVAQQGEQPWVYTRGITGALTYLGMEFEEVLLYTQKALIYLDDHTVTSKEALDKTLADRIADDLPVDKRLLWNAPSMYGNPQKQTVGGAAVSFMLRPCSFMSLVVFGQRQGASPTFTSFKNWVGHMPGKNPNPEKELLRKFLHCYGPSTKEHFMSWLGCCWQQAHRLWGTIADELEPVEAEGKTAYMLQDDMQDLLQGEAAGDELLLLGAHDPYLDLRDRFMILEDKARQKIVWQFVANPGVVLRGGRVVGIWKAKTQKQQMDISITLWEGGGAATQKKLSQLAQEYASFRTLRLKSCTVQ